MVTLDLRTIFFTGVVIDVICTLVVVALWRQNGRRYGGMAYIAAGFASQTVGLLLIVLRGAVPDWLSVVVANTLVIGGDIATYMGLERFVDRRGPRVHNYLLLALFCLVHSYLTFIRPNVAARNLNSSIAILAISLQGLWLLLHRAEPAMRRLARRVSAILGAYGLVCCYRIVWFFVGPDTGNDFLHSGESEALVQVSFLVLFILLTYSMALTVGRRLQMEVRAQEERFSAAFHSSPYAISLTRLSDGRIFEVNPAFAAMTGYPVEEVRGRTTAELRFWAHEGDRGAIIDELGAGGEVRGREIPFRRKNGELLTGLYSADVITVGNEESILASIVDITERKREEAEREQLLREREAALSEVKALSGMLPICSSCKKIRDDSGYWSQIESYIESHSEAEFTHGICPDCMRKLYPEMAEPKDKEPA